MPGNSQRKGAVRHKGKGNTAGSGGRVRRGLEGKGPTPKAEDRPYHAAHKAKKAARSDRDRARPTGSRTGRPGSGPEWVAGRNAVLEAMEAEIPIKTAYVAEGAERDDRLRDILKLAADRGTPLLEVTRAELDRLTGGAVHQGVALQLPAYAYAHPDDLLADALAADTEPLIVALDSVTDPRNLGAVVRSAAAFGAARRADSRAPLGRHDRRGLEDLGRRGGPDPDRPGHQPQPHPARVRRRRTRAWSGWTGGGYRHLAEVAELSGPLVLVVGSEGAGLSRLVREACDTLAAIPIAATVESLNAGVAAGIALYEITRRRQVGG